MLRTIRLPAGFAAGPALGRWRERLARASAAVARAMRRSASRRALPYLTDEQLKDIGLCRPDALAESAKPFWRT